MPENKVLVYQYFQEPKTRTRHYIDMPVDLSRKSISAYAYKIGAEYEFRSENLPGNLEPFFGIFVPFFEEREPDYDFLVYMDTDIMATRDSKNIIEHCSSDTISISFMTTQRRWQGQGRSFFAKHGHANSGVVAFPRKCFGMMKEYSRKIEDMRQRHGGFVGALGGFDQAIINLILEETKTFEPLPVEFNYHLTRLDKAARFQQSLIHYHRKNKTMMPDDFKKDNILK